MSPLALFQRYKTRKRQQKSGDTSANSESTVVDPEPPSDISLWLTEDPLVKTERGPTDSGTEIDTAMKRYANTGWEGLKLILRVLKESSDGLTPLKAAVGGAVALIDIFENTKSASVQLAETAQRVDRLMLILANRLGEGERIETSIMIGHYEILLSELLKGVKDKYHRGWIRRVIENDQDRDTLASTASRIADMMQELQLKIGLSLEKATGQILDEVVFQHLERAEAAAYSAAISPNGVSRRSCAVGTRVEIIDDILAWVFDESESTAPVYWMSGLAGQGKTTIAYTICDQLKSRADDVSVVSFFCSAQLDSTWEKLLVSTLAFELAESSSSYAAQLLLVLQAERNLSHQRLEYQMRRLFVEPWAGSAHRRKDLRPTIIVVDAVDENEAGIEFIDLLLSALHKGQLPGLRILITSRPSPELVTLFGRANDVRRLNLNDCNARATHHDILTYLKTELPEHAERRELQDVADVAAGLFIYAATARRIVRPKGIRRTLDEEVVKLRQLSARASTVTSPGLLDDLYNGILERLFAGLDLEEQAQRQRVILTVMCHSRPLTVLRLSELAEVKEDLIQLVIDVLHPVLYIGELNLVLWYHTSFRDYILVTHENLLCPTWTLVSRNYWVIAQRDTPLAKEVESLTTLFFGLHPSDITESNVSQRLVDAIALPLQPRMGPNLEGYIVPNPPSDYAHSSTSHKKARVKSAGRRPKSLPAKGKAHQSNNVVVA
ncbi:unnamed protein product [Peniophora sp. CBMAI 1063]|nr:unnamed protein product [Peniophora sp. CBMAI 1063]